MRRLLLFSLLCFSVNLLVAQEKQLPFERIEPFKEDMAIVVKDGKYGFVNRDYKVVIPPIYLEAQDFSEGLAAVQLDDSLALQQGLSYWIFIDKAGKQAIPDKYEYVDHPFKEGLAVAHIYKGERFETAVINREGKVVMEKSPNLKLPFQFGMARLENDSSTKYGVVNLQGKAVVPVKFDQVILLSPALIQVGNGDQFGFYNSDGKKLTKLIYKAVDTLNNGFVSVMVKEKYGLLNKEGKEVAPIKYERIGDFEEGLAVVKRKDKWGYIDEAGKEVIPIKYESARSFVNGKAAVTLDNKDLYIDKNGKYVDERYTNFVLSSESLTKETAEKAFLSILNTLVKTYPYADQGEEAFLDSVFSIQNGFLVGTYREYASEGIVFRRLSMPVAKIQEVWYDYNMGFYVEENTGIIQATKPGETSFGAESTTGMLHLATPKDGVHGWRWKEQLTIALEALKKYYP